MAVVYKGFRSYEINSNGDIVQDMGNLIMPVVTSTGTAFPSGTQYFNDAPSLIAYYSTYITDLDSYGTRKTFTDVVYPKILEIAPLATRFTGTLTAGNSIKIIASSGYYAIGTINTLLHGVNNWTLYNDSGEVMASPISNTFGMPYSSNESNMALTVVDSIIDGLIVTNSVRGLSCFWYNSENHYSTSITGNMATSIRTGFVNWLNNIGQVLEPVDPYANGGTTDDDPTGGTGDFDNTSIDIPIPDLPTLSAIDTGFVTLYSPTLAQLQSLASYMWSTDFYDTIVKLFANPMDTILGLSIVPLSVPTSGARSVKVGNVSTDISMNVASGQWVSFPCGTLNVNEFWGAYLDYSPYTKVEIFLPYIGVQQLDIDDIMGKSVYVEYHIDLFSGACVAFIRCNNTVLYQFNGSVCTPVPVTNADFTSAINSIISIAGSVIAGAGMGGIAGAATAGVSAAAQNIANFKPSIGKSGTIGGSTGMMAVQTPYLILTRPKQALPASQNSYTGYPSFKTRQLSDLSGYTEMYKIFLNNLDCTNAEKDEISGLLEGGVIL